jgi:divalent metal cation (Fe/Co/Zn/Cd) transporter
MPLLAWQKRKLARRTGNNALAADAVQSTTCAYLALIALAGLVLNAAFHVAWADSVAALAAIPILIVEGRRAMRGQSCGCC